MVAQIDSFFASHDGGIRVGGAHLIIGDALIVATFHAAILCSLWPGSSRDALHCAGSSSCSWGVGSSVVWYCSTPKGSSASVSNTFLNCASTAKRGFTDSFPALAATDASHQSTTLSPIRVPPLDTAPQSCQKSDERPQGHSVPGCASGLNDLVTVLPSRTRRTTSR